MSRGFCGFFCDNDLIDKNPRSSCSSNKTESLLLTWMLCKASLPCGSPRCVNSCISCFRGCWAVHTERWWPVTLAEYKEEAIWWLRFRILFISGLPCLEINKHVQYLQIVCLFVWNSWQFYELNTSIVIYYPACAALIDCPDCVSASPPGTDCCALWPWSEISGS